MRSLLLCGALLSVAVFGGRGVGIVLPRSAPMLRRLLLLEEVDDRGRLSPGFLSVMSHPVWSRLSADGVPWRRVDDDQDVGVSWQPLFERAKADSLGVRPWLVVESSVGVSSSACPSDAAGLRSILVDRGGALWESSFLGSGMGNWSSQMGLVSPRTELVTPSAVAVTSGETLLPIHYSRRVGSSTCLLSRARSGASGLRTRRPGVLGHRTRCGVLGCR